MKTILSKTDPIGSIIGEIGRWQFERMVLTFIISCPGLAHIFSVIFATQKTDFWCKDGLKNVTNEDACNLGCTDFEYDRSYWTNTIIMEYDMVCDKKYLTTLTKMVIFAGFGCGTFGSGLISDKYGRRTAILLMSQLLYGSGILATIMPNYYLFIIAWFLSGIAAIGIFTVAVVWNMEAVSGQWKTIMAVIISLTWPIGRFMTAAVSWYSRDWKVIVQALCSLALATPILMYWVPESPRWLLSSQSPGSKEQSEKILRDAATRNGFKEGDEPYEKIKTVYISSSKETVHFWKIFEFAILRKRALIMYFNWFTNAFILYGLSLNWKALTGNLFFNFILGSALDFPAKFLSCMVLRQGGRKLLYLICVIVTGLCMMASLLFEKDDFWPIIILMMTGNFCISCSFSILWIYTAELFPTNMRNGALGSSSFNARVGGIMATTIGSLAELHVALPKILFGITAIISGILTLFLPETGHIESLPNSIQDCKDIEGKFTFKSLFFTEKKSASTSTELEKTVEDVELSKTNDK